MNTDGNQGQPAPTAQEISMAQSVFQKLADAIVNMSRLADQVASLQVQVNGMSDELDRLRRTNDALEESLSHSRQARHEMQDQLNKVQHDLTQAAQERDENHRRAETQAQDNERLRQSLEITRKERDDAEFKHMELEEKLKAAEAKLERIQSSFGEVFGHVPESTSMPTAPSAPTTNTPPAQPEPTQAELQAQSGEPAHSPVDPVDWSKPYRWNAEKGNYENYTP